LVLVKSLLELSNDRRDLQTLEKNLQERERDRGNKRKSSDNVKIFDIPSSVFGDAHYVAISQIEKDLYSYPIDAEQDRREVNNHSFDIIAVW
jgi:hypothetical protein